LKITLDFTDTVNGSINESFFYGFRWNKENDEVIFEMQMPICTKENIIYNQIQYAIKLYGIKRIVCIYKVNNIKQNVNDLQEISTVIQNSGGAAIYGWEFLSDKEWKKNRLKAKSYEYNISRNDTSSLLNIFHDGSDVGRNHFIDLYVWFSDFNAVPSNINLNTQELIQAGYDWWEEFYKNNPKTQEAIQRPKKDELGNIEYIGSTYSVPGKKENEES